MNILALETSTNYFSLAVAKDYKILASQTVCLNKVLSSSIIPGIDKILKNAKIKLNRIDVFVIGLGPGSFTSLRVGLSTIKGLAFAQGKPIVGVTSLAAIAMNVKNDGLVAVVTDARRQMVYASLFEKHGEKLKSLANPSLSAISDLLPKINGKVTFVGDGLELYQKEINAYAKTQTSLIPSFTDKKFWPPQAKHLIGIATAKIQTKKFDDINKLAPIYLYPEDCQVQP